jgi:hypothetical protein
LKVMLHAGPRAASSRGRSLGHELALVIGLKLLALLALYVLCFSPAHRPPIDPIARIAGGATSHSR